MSSRIATAALTGRIYMGRVNKAGTDFVGQTTDVTSDVMKAIIDKAEHHGDGGFDIEAGDRRWTVNVTQRATTDKTPTADRVLGDAARYRWLADYLVGDLTDLDDEIVACKSVYDLSKVVDAARKQGANHG